MARPLHLHIYNVVIGDETRDLYLTDRVLDAPVGDAFPVEMAGYALFPGLINAHDHLELNHFPRSKFRDVYGNAHQWGEEVGARLDDPPFGALRAYPLSDRLFIGGLKNLLCGATTVAHHNPLHQPLRRADFPVRVVERYGWAHSLHFDPDVRCSYTGTPPDAPWIIHLAEGTDGIAALEYRQLKALGCAGPNMVLVHGVGLRPADIQEAAGQVRGLVWCPSTNAYLLGATANMRAWLEAGGRLALGSDSRLTADGDLLDEMRAARATGQVDAPTLLDMVMAGAAQMFGLADVGHLRPGARADLIAVPADVDLTQLRRSDLALVMRGGVPQIGDPALMARFPRVETVPATLDGRPKAIHAGLARRMVRCGLQEPGLVVEPVPGRRWALWRRLRKGVG